MEAGREQNYWPGFVDALSNVVLTLVFVLVVFVFALVIASNKIEQKANQMVLAAHEKVLKGDAAPIIADLKTELEKAKVEIQALREQERTHVEKTVTIAVDDKSGLLVTGTVKISRMRGKILIIFPNAVSTLDEQSFAALDRLLEEMKDEIGGKKVSMLSYIGVESYSAARRLAYYRVLGLRNHLMEKIDLKGSSISSQILQPRERQDGRIEILFN